MKIDILILAIIVIFIFLKLRSVLGQRTGSEKDHYNLLEEAESISSIDPIDAVEGQGREAGLKRIRLADPTFSESKFIEGAKKAYECIIVAFHKGDQASLKPLLSPSVFKDFVSEMASELSLEAVPTVHIQDAELQNAELRGYSAYITVCFTARLKGIGETQDLQQDTWTFSRNTRSENPNWLLVSTSSAA